MAALTAAAVSLLVVLTAQTLLTDFKLDRASLRQEECMCRLVQIRLALNLYARDNDGRLPLSLDALVDGEFKYVERNNLCCPRSGMEYLFLLAGRGGRLDALGWDQPLLADAGFPHLGGKMVFYRGGVHLYVSKERFERASAEHPASFEEALRAVAPFVKGSPGSPGSE